MVTLSNFSQSGTDETPKDAPKEDLQNQFLKMLDGASTEKLTMMIDFLAGTPTSRTISERALFDPTVARKEVRARDKAQARESHLDVAPNGGVFMTPAGTYVNFDGKPCDEEGKITSSRSVNEEETGE